MARFGYQTTGGAVPEGNRTTAHLHTGTLISDADRNLRIDHAGDVTGCGPPSRAVPQLLPRRVRELDVCESARRTPGPGPDNPARSRALRGLRAGRVGGLA